MYANNIEHRVMAQIYYENWHKFHKLKGIGRFRAVGITIIIPKRQWKVREHIPKQD